jgi:hypothetical protein
LHHQNLLQGQWWVGSVVVLSIVVPGVSVSVPCVDHLKNRWDKEERGWGREIMMNKEIPI